MNTKQAICFHLECLIENMLFTNDLHEYAENILELTIIERPARSKPYDLNLIKKQIIKSLAANTVFLNKNGMEMLLANIDDYADQIGYNRDDIDADDIEAAMERDLIF